MRTTGHNEETAVAGEKVRAFIPLPLPPKDPPIHIEGELAAALRRAEQSLARLELAGEMIPSKEWFLYAFVRKEAVLSSQIEGTQATLMDLLNFEAGGSLLGADETDILEVCNYLDALKYARAEIAKATGLPVSMRLLNETHKRLLKGVRGRSKQPGEIRRSQNWIGGNRPGNAAFVPPPPHQLAGLLSNLENYIHKEDALPPLVRAGLIHVQFETIHPYLDGNGRIGRLLITLLLEEWKLLSEPLLYLSLYFKRNQRDYYDQLNRVRTQGDWESWLGYFLTGIAEIADEAVDTSRELFAVVSRDRAKLLKAKDSSVMSIRLFEELPRRPVVTMPAVVRALQTTKPTAAKAIKVLENIDILIEETGRGRDRTWRYKHYLDRLGQ